MLDHYSLKPSTIFTLSLLGAFLLATASVWLTHLDFWWRLVLVVLVCLAILEVLWRDVLLKQATSWQRFSLTGRQVRVCRRGVGDVQGEVMQRTLVTPLCVVLWVKPERGPSVAHVIFRDSLPDGAFRELCVRLKYC